LTSIWWLETWQIFDPCHCDIFITWMEKFILGCVYHFPLSQVILKTTLVSKKIKLSTSRASRRDVSLREKNTRTGKTYNRACIIGAASNWVEETDPVSILCTLVNLLPAAEQQSTIRVRLGICVAPTRKAIETKIAHINAR